MKISLLIHAWVEMIAGFILLFNPSLLLLTTDQNLQTISVSKLYGIIAFSFGLAVYIITKGFVYNLIYKRLILLIICFHLLVSFHMYNLYAQKVVSIPGAFVLHIVMASLFLVLYFKNINQWKDAQST